MSLTSFVHPVQSALLTSLVYSTFLPHVPHLSPSSLTVCLAHLSGTFHVFTACPSPLSFIPYSLHCSPLQYNPRFYMSLTSRSSRTICTVTSPVYSTFLPHIHHLYRSSRTVCTAHLSSIIHVSTCPSPLVHPVQSALSPLQYIPRFYHISIISIVHLVQSALLTSPVCSIFLPHVPHFSRSSRTVCTAYLSSITHVSTTCPSLLSFILYSLHCSLL